MNEFNVRMGIKSFKAIQKKFETFKIAFGESFESSNAFNIENVDIKTGERAFQFEMLKHTIIVKLEPLVTNESVTGKVVFSRLLEPEKTFAFYELYISSKGGISNEVSGETIVVIFSEMIDFFYSEQFEDILKHFFYSFSSDAPQIEVL